MTSQALTDSSLRRHRLVIARAAGLVLVALILALFVVAIPTRYHQLLAPSADSDRGLLQLTPEEAQALPHLGLSLNVYAGCLASLESFFSVIFVIIGAMIFRRSS